MNPVIFEKQRKIHELFSAMRVLEGVEWIDSITDDHYPNVCPLCGGFQAYKHSPENVGHRDDCQLVKTKRELFRQAVDIASSIPDGNLFINLVVGIHLSKPAQRFG